MFADVAQFNAAKKHQLNEVMTQVVASKVVRPGDVVLDLGANVGYHTRFLASLAGETGKVHAFEPNPDLWRHLTAYPNTRLWPVAVGDVVSVERFRLPLDFDQVGSIVDPRDFMGDVPTKILSVPQVPVDLLDEIFQNAIVFVKIDVERREAFALRGMKKLLARDMPILVYENHTAEIQEILDSLGYQIFDLLHEVGLPGIVANVVAIPSAKVGDVQNILPSAEDIARCINSAEMATL
jgi:FkbM family methyltransferase